MSKTLQDSSCLRLRSEKVHNKKRSGLRILEVYVEEDTAGLPVKIKGEVRRKMNFTYVLGFVVLRDVVKVFPVSSSSFARKTTGGIEHEVNRGHDAA